MCLSFSFSPTVRTRFWNEAVFSFQHHLISRWTVGRREGRAVGLLHYPEDNWFIKQNYNGLCHGTHTNDLNLSSFSILLQKSLCDECVLVCVCVCVLLFGIKRQLEYIPLQCQMWVLLMSFRGCPIMKYVLQKSICKMVCLKSVVNIYLKIHQKWLVWNILDSD